jgi:DNA primase catalytic core
MALTNFSYNSTVGGIFLATSLRLPIDGYVLPVKGFQAKMPDSLRDIIIQVKENADLVAIIGQYVPLKKAGAKYVGLCPFHHDRSPSLNVTPQMGIYKCFACGAGGDVLKFVQEYEKLDFLDALRLVAEKAGVTIPERIAHSKDEGDRGKSALVLAANQLACRLYQEELESNPEVLAYVEKRGITTETRKHFQLGLAPQSPEKLLKRGAAKDIPVEAFVEAGILGESYGRTYDRFGGRLIFPIWNLSGHVIGFGGRVLEAGQQPKYYNSPESPFYHKSKVLYGLNFSRGEIDKSGEVVLVEGYMDLLSLWQAGVRNAVAVSGTALTKDHVHILARFARKAYLFFDGDAPGRKAVRRSLEPLLSMGVEVKVPVLPAEEDPDSFTKNQGGDKVRALFSQSDDLVGFLLRDAAKPVDAMSPEEKDGLLQDGLSLLQNIPSPLVRDQYLDEFRKKLGLKTIRVAVSRSAPMGNFPVTSVAAPVAPGLQLASGSQPREEAVPEWQLLQILLSSLDMCRAALDALKLEWLQDAAVRGLIDHVLAFVEESGGLDLKAFQERLSSADRDVLSSVGVVEKNDPEKLRKQMSDILTALEIRSIKKKMGGEKDMAKHMEYLKRIKELQSKSKGGNA